jgi:RHS repeat-associated protein
VLKSGRILLFACLYLWTLAGVSAITSPENPCSRDAASALYNARYCDPQLGRFIQPDTAISDLSNPQSYNRYSYCVNDPLRYTDPTGHWGQEVADWWSGTVGSGANYISAGPSHWVWNGTVGTVNILVGGVAEPLRLGSSAGAVSGNPNATAGQIAIAGVQEVSRAAALVPVGAAIGKGAGVLLGAGEKEAAGELAGAAGKVAGGN